MKRVLVTTKPNDFELSKDIEVVSSISSVQQVEPNMLLILNTYTEDEYEAGIRIAELIEKGLSKLYYLTDDPKLNMYSLVASLNGVNETEDYLLDEESLEVLISETETNELLPATVGVAEGYVSPNSVDILKRFYQDYTSGNIEGLANTAYLQLVDRAINDIANSSNELIIYDKDVKETVNQLYTQAFHQLNELEDSKDEIEATLLEVQEMYDELKGQSTTLGKLDSFSPYRHVKSSGVRLIVFKEYTQVRYLTSFVMGYAEHLANIMHKRVRVLFVVPNKDTFLKKYKTAPANFYHLTGDNYNTEDALNSTLYYTEVPILRMYKHLTNLNDDILLIVDRTYNNDFAVKGNVTSWHAFAGKSEADVYTKQKSNRIFSMRGVTTSDIVIAHIPKYEVEVINRQAQYSNTFTETYKRLDQINKVYVN